MRFRTSILFLPAALVAALLSGCAQIATGINQVNAALTSTAANQAVANLEAGATVLICNIPSLASQAAAIETALAKGQIATLDPKSALAKTYEITSTVLAVSQDVCTGLQGTAGGKAAISAISNGVATAAPVGATH
jgi:PBP1b-binding outer membrane lipoprotein LpoB